MLITSDDDDNDDNGDDPSAGPDLVAAPFPNPPKIIRQPTEEKRSKQDKERDRDGRDADRDKTREREGRNGEKDRGEQCSK